jgi:hypothetical protein
MLEDTGTSFTNRGPHNRMRTYTNLSGSVTGVIPVLAGECVAISIKFQGLIQPPFLVLVIKASLGIIAYNRM